MENAPVTSALHRLLAAKPVRAHAVSFVALHARVPSEARTRDGDPLQWAFARTRCRPLNRRIVRVRHTSGATRLLLPGVVLTTGVAKRYACVANYCALESDRPEFLEAQVRRGTRTFVEESWLDLDATGALLADPERDDLAPPFAIPDLASSAQLNRALRATRRWAETGDGTRIGMVALVGGEPVAAWVFEDAETFRRCSADLIAVTVATAEHRVGRGANLQEMRMRAETSRARGRAIEFLRRAAA
ncbi:MAG: hypothetical protein AAGD14_18730, partial [Planctomycetota bacterium]